MAPWLSIATVALLVVAAAGGADARGRCTRSLAPGGDLDAFANKLAPGMTGCLLPGVYEIGTDLAIRTGGVLSKRITLTSAERRRPAVIRGRFWVADTANYWTFAHLRFDGRNEAFLPSPSVNGDFSTWRDVEVTNHRAGAGMEEGGICFYLGATAKWGYAVGTTIERSRIHHCGVSTNHNHGIYVVATRGRTLIRDNLIYENGDRGIQLYPDGDGVVLEHNVLDGNGIGVIFGGRDGLASDGARVHGNVISNSRVRNNVEAFWPENNPIGTDNLVTGNCLWASNAEKHGWYRRDGGVSKQVGFRASANLLARPVFVDPARGDYRQRASSPCRRYGPRPNAGPARPSGARSR